LVTLDERLKCPLVAGEASFNEGGIFDILW
jgi:hypothetical protein